MSEQTDYVIRIPTEHERNIFGQFDANLKKIEHALSVGFVERNGELRITGDEKQAEKAQE